MLKFVTTRTASQLVLALAASGYAIADPNCLCEGHFVQDGKEANGPIYVITRPFRQEYEFTPCENAAKSFQAKIQSEMNFKEAKFAACIGRRDRDKLRTIYDILIREASQNSSFSGVRETTFEAGQ